MSGLLFVGVLRVALLDLCAQWRAPMACVCVCARECLVYKHRERVCGFDKDEWPNLFLLCERATAHDLITSTLMLLAVAGGRCDLGKLRNSEIQHHKPDHRIKLKKKKKDRREGKHRVRSSAVGD